MDDDVEARAGQALVDGLHGVSFVKYLFPKDVVKAADIAENIMYGDGASGESQSTPDQLFGIDDQDLALLRKFRSGTLPRKQEETIPPDVTAAYRRIEDAVAKGLHVDVANVRACIQARNNMFDWEAISAAIGKDD